MLVWLSFVQVFHLLLNSEAKEFASFSDSLGTCFQIILGKFNSNAFTQAQSFLPMPFFVAYNVVIIFIMVNLMVSILVSGFDSARKDTHLSDDDPDMFDYLKEVFVSLNPFENKDKKKNEESQHKAQDYVNFTQSWVNSVDKFLDKFKCYKNYFEIFILKFSSIKIFSSFLLIAMVNKSTLHTMNATLKDLNK
jgi:hypothetical protein